MRAFTCRDSELWKKLYISLVRPHLEFASTVWNPHTEGDKKTLEKVQERATKIPLEMKNRKYEDRLKIWEITSLTERRKRGDLIQTYKIKSNLESINWFTGPLQAPLTQTRSATNNEQRLMRELFPSKTRNELCHHVSVRHEFYLNRVVEDWN